MKIIHFAQFSAPYKGSFINALEFLSQKFEDKRTFCFPEEVLNYDWIHEITSQNTVYFTSKDVKKSSPEIFKILHIEQPNIVHSHFDGYDIPLLKAVNKYNRNKPKPKQIKVIWHKHNFYSYNKNFFKKLYQFFYFTFKYTYLGRKVNYIYVSEVIKLFIDRYQFLISSCNKQVVIPNGIHVDKFQTEIEFVEKPIFTYISYGGRNKDKRIDLLLNAGILLSKEKVDFKIVITKGSDTEQIVREIFGLNIPSWLELIGQTNDIVNLLKNSSCFVSCSVHETFSNAIAEATLIGVPVIQSDIEGTLWNSKNPSTFLFKSKDFHSLFYSMLEVINYPKKELLESVKITQLNNRQIYNLDIWSEKINQFYSEVNE